MWVSDDWGYLKQVSNEDLTEIKDFSKIHKGGIWSICATSDDKYIYTSDDVGYIKQFDNNNSCLVKDHGCLHPAFIRCIYVTPDNS